MISSDHLEPGQTGKIEVTVDTSGRKGRLEKHVAVTTNDETNRIVTLSLEVQILEKPGK